MNQMGWEKHLMQAHNVNPDDEKLPESQPK